MDLDEMYYDGAAEQFPVFAVLLLILIIYLLKRYFRKELSRWGYLMDFIKVPTDEFYQKVESKLKETELQNVSFKVVNKRQGSIFSTRRKYLRIRYKEYNSFVCCMPVGRGTHVTWWMRHHAKLPESIIGYIPILGQIINLILFPHTYYRYDSAEAYLTYFQGSVTEVVDNILKENDIKALSENERVYIRNPKVRM